MISSSHRTHPALSARVPCICIALVIAALLCAIVGSPSVALAGPTVTVRIEGESSTLLPLTTVTLEKPEPVSGCPADSANAAINLAVKGNWDHGEEEGSSGDFTETILGETHAFTHESDTWAVWIDDKWGGGICEDLLSEGQELLLIADHEPEPFAPTVLPLVLAGVPSTAVAGVPFNVTVNKVHTRPGTFPEIGEGTPEPESGVTVSGAGASAVTGANGLATLTLSTPGTYTLVAREPGAAPSAPIAVCVRTSSEPACGVPGSTGAANGVIVRRRQCSPHRPLQRRVRAGPTPDRPRRRTRLHPRPRPAHPRGQRARAHDRLLDQPDSASLLSTPLLLLRRRRAPGSFAPAAARATRSRCPATASFSYLLPSALAPGRYVLDIQATDAAGNSTTLARGTSRIVFYVR